MQALMVAISLWLFSSFNTNEKQLTNTLTLEIENTIKIEEVLPRICQPKEILGLKWETLPQKI